MLQILPRVQRKALQEIKKSRNDQEARERIYQLANDIQTGAFDFCCRQLYYDGVGDV
jgi:hypothetical protein